MRLQVCLVSINYTFSLIFFLFSEILVYLINTIFHYSCCYFLLQLHDPKTNLRIVALITILDIIDKLM